MNIIKDYVDDETEAEHEAEHKYEISIYEIKKEIEDALFSAMRLKRFPKTREGFKNREALVLKVVECVLDKYQDKTKKIKYKVLCRFTDDDINIDVIKLNSKE